MLKNLPRIQYNVLSLWVALQRHLPIGCTFPHKAGPLCLLVHFVLEKLQNDPKSKAECRNNLFAIFDFTGLAKELYKPGAKIVAMDNGGLA